MLSMLKKTSKSGESWVFVHLWVRQWRAYCIAVYSSGTTCDQLYCGKHASCADTFQGRFLSTNPALRPATRWQATDSYTFFSFFFLKWVFEVQAVFATRATSALARTCRHDSDMWSGIKRPRCLASRGVSCSCWICAPLVAWWKCCPSCGHSCVGLRLFEAKQQQGLHHITGLTTAIGWPSRSPHSTPTRWRWSSATLARTTWSSA